ncbi:sorting nexin, putative [Schistosoma mansoni]|uniref:sorting nexin, putative n=1 Tax=Schistosoma mansoni TaxID=6183 RepID=UPI00022C831E|nr:sorting nexin, putative [Schistosoma mansoni]|eukprot:XP_018645660.1 sorting nexin, putative [Schistosoma mansoni]
MKEQPVVHFRRRDLLCSKGIPKVTAIMDAEGVTRPNIRVSPHQDLDYVLNQIVSYIVRDYITPWYNSLTPDDSFPMELHKLLLRVVANAVKRVSDVDWVPFLTEMLPSFMTTHVRVYRNMLDRKVAYPDRDSAKLFFDIEAETEKSVCHEEICNSGDREKDHLRLLSDMFLFFVTPTEEYGVPGIRYIARELLVNSVLIPMINLLSDPDFVNRTIAWFASDSAYTSEYFCQALRMSESIEEIDVVIRQLNSFMDKLRGHDTGGDDDALIKAQLGSLDYVRKICLIRRRQIQEGVAEKPGRALAYHLQPDARIYDMSFQELMTKSVAVVCFLDFLASINKHSLLRLYLNCVSFREGVSKLIPNATINQNIDPSVLALAEASRMEAISSDMSTTIITDDLCLNPTNPIEITNTDKETLSVSYSLNFEGTQTEVASNLCDNEIDLMGKEDSITTSLDEGEQQNTMVINEEIKKNILEKSGDDIVDDSIEQLRAFGITICSNLLHFMPLSAEPLIQRTLKTLTGEPNSLNPNSFTEIEAHIVNILSSPDCFGAFKRSSQYIHLLAELDLLKEPLEQSSSSNFISIPPISNDTLPQSQSQSLSQSDKITVSSGSIIHNISSLSQMPCSANSVEDCTDWKCIENDSSKETKQSGLPRLSESRIISTTNTTGRGAFDDVYTAAITRAEIMHDSYVIYTIKVTRTVLSTSQSESWNTLRRFRHFVELHSFLTNRCGRITELKLPSKIAFNNMSPEFLAQRRRGLNVYLNTLCSSEFQNNHPGSRPLCIEFLQPDSWERGHVEARIVSAILTPFRTVSNAMMSVPDTLADGLNKIFANKNFPTSNSPILSRNDEMMKKSSEFELQESLDMSLESSKSSDSYDYNVRDETPIQILFLLVDEIFDLHRESQFTRQGNFAILRKIFQTFFGIRVNKMIIAKACEWTSAPKITQLITYLRDYFWPPKNKSSNTTALTERDKEMKLRTRVLCRTVLLGSVSEEFAQFLGNETTRRGVSCVFNMLQEERFNRRFVHTVLEAFLCQLFRPYHDIGKLFMKKIYAH